MHIKLLMDVKLAHYFKVRRKHPPSFALLASWWSPGWRLDLDISGLWAGVLERREERGERDSNAVEARLGQARVSDPSSPP